MNKTIQTIVLTLVISIGIGARLSLLGWMFVIGLGSALVFGISHLMIHSKCTNYFAAGGRSASLKFILSHIFFLGIFLFQDDFDDSRSYSVLGYAFGIDAPFLEKNGLYLIGLGVSIVGYVWVSISSIRQAKRADLASSSTEYIVPALIGSLILIPVTIKGIHGLKELAVEKEMEGTGQFLSIKRALKNPEAVTSIKLASTFPKLTEFPVEILDLPNLKAIDLSKQDISTIPDEIQKARKLEVLNLLDNNIHEIPSSICKCENLKELRIGGNIKEFPKCLREMKSLKHLSIQSNTVNELMDELREFENIETAHFYLKEGVFDRDRFNQIERETGLNQE